MKLLKSVIGAALAFALTAGIYTPNFVNAANKQTCSIIFDYNEDNVTDENDIKDFSQSKFLRIPVMQPLLYGESLPRDCDTTQADGISRFFLTNINQVTSPKYQKPLGDCWAHAAVGAVESAALKAENHIDNPTNAIDEKAFDNPVLSGFENKYDFSERAVAWFFAEPVKKSDSLSQAGEGFEYPDSGIKRFVEGGAGAYTDTLFTAWRGVLKEETAPHRANNWNGSLKTLDKSSSDWALPAELSAESFENAPRVTDCLSLPSFSTFTTDVKTGNRKWGGHNENARSIVKQALIDYGAVITDYDANLDSRNSCFYTEKTETLPSHAVLIVGWDDNYSKDNFTVDGKPAPTEDGAWLVKNSWGCYDYMKSRFENWDIDREGFNGMTFKESEEYAEKRNTTIEELTKDYSKNVPNKYLYEFGIRDSEDRGTGFFWIYYTDRSLGNATVYKTDIADDGYDFDNNYQYDFAMCDENLRWSLRTSDTDTLVSNIFTANGEYEKLKAFSAYTNESNSTVKTDIYFLNGSETNPNQGELVYSTEDTLKFAGFHTIKLDNEINLTKGQKFAVVQNIKALNPKTNTEVSFLNLETSVKDTLDGISPVKSNVICNDGETFVRLDGIWTTPEELNENLDLAQVFTFGNAKIKAFTTEEVPEDPIPSEINPVEDVKKDITACTVGGIKNKTYNGKAQTQSVVVKDGETKLIQDTDYTVSYKNNKNAGTATVTITGIGAYEKSITKTYKIAKAKNPMTVKAKKAVKAKAKKKTTIKRVVTVKKARGSVKYKTNNKRITVKSGKLIVKKGLKKNKTYSLKITVSAKGNANYKSARKTVTIKVKVK